MTPLFTLGSLSVTPYSLLVFAGALAGVLLAGRKKEIRPLLPAVLLGALLFGHLSWALLCPPDFEAADGKLAMILRPWEGGYNMYGALLGGALGALIAGKAAGVRWTDALDALAPGACAAIVFARVGEVFTGEGIGRWTEVEWIHFFPFSTCTYQDEYFQEWRFVIWFWEALAALVLLFLLLKREKKALPGRQTVLFVTFLGVSQILLEQARLDQRLLVFTYAPVNQLAAIATLAAVLAVLMVRRRPGPLKTALGAAVLVTAALADMAAEFVFDKFEYAPWLYAAIPVAAVCSTALLLVWKKRRGLLPAVLVILAAAGLAIAYASRPWDEMELTPVEDMIRYHILFGIMALELTCICVDIRLNLKD